MKHNAILGKPPKDGWTSFVGCTIFAATAKNAQVLRPLAQTITRLEENRKNFAYCNAIAERFIDGDLAITFESGMVQSHRFRKATIDMAAGRQPRIVFCDAGNKIGTVAIEFTQTVAHEWLTQRVHAGCLDCGGNYVCPSCSASKATPQPTIAA